MIIFGAVDFTAALARVAKVLGYRVTVCDARAVFATVQRFPMADEVVNDWPDRYLAKVGDELGPRDAVCVLTHDHKFDVPAIVGRGADRRRLPRCDGLAAHARRAASSGCASAGVTDDELARVDVADRARHRRPHTRGDRGRDLRRDHRDAHRAAGSRRSATPPVPSTDARRAAERSRVDLGIAGKRAAVAAASQGLGLATAEALAARRRAGRDLRPASRRDRRRGREHRRRYACRSSPTSRRPTARPASCATRATRSAASTSSSPTPAARPPGDFASTTVDQYLDAFELNCRSLDRHVLRGGARDARRSGGGGCSRSRRSRCASRSRT